MWGLVYIMRIANFSCENISERLMFEEANHGLEVAPVLKAATLGLLSTVQSLLAEGAGASTRCSRDEISSLGAAALMGHLEIMRALIDHGVDVDNADSSGETALHKAVDHGRPDLIDLLLPAIDLLLSHGADIDAPTTNGCTPLHFAAKWPEPGDAATLLIHRGAAKYMIAIGGCSPLHVAARSGHLAVTRALLAAGVNATLRVNGHGHDHAPLDMAAAAGHAEVIRELVLHGVDLDASPEPDGLTALHYAVLNEHAGAVEALVEAGACFTSQMFQSETALYFASQRQLPEIQLVLLRHGAPVGGLPGEGVDQCRESPLHGAARMGGLLGAAAAVDLLLKWGADESELRSDGKTAAQIVGVSVTDDFQPEWRLPSDADRVRELLAGAPANKAWRRRGLLLLCLARNRTARRRRNTGVSGQGKEEGEVALAGGRGGGRGEGGAEKGGVLDNVVALLPKFEEQGFFRTIVGYL